MTAANALSREVPIEPAHAALLFIDVQNYNCLPDGGEYAGLSDAEREPATAISSAPCAIPRCPTCGSCRPPAGGRGSR